MIKNAATVELVFLPVTDADDTACGVMPTAVPGFAHLRCHHVRFEHLVWYNPSIRARTIAQIRALNVGPVVLMGFSKSGLGAWNLARELGEQAAATVIFDAPVSRLQTPPWGTAPFYADDQQWQRDLPLCQVSRLQHRFASGPLILISGNKFHSEMEHLSQRLHESAVPHLFLPRPQWAHHWSAGWVEESARLLVELGVCGRR